MAAPAPGRPAVVLLSGGLDSATSLAWAVERGFAAHALTVDYGQRHRGELDAAARLAASLGAASGRVVRVELPGAVGSALTNPALSLPRERAPEEIGRGIPATYVPARNLLFLALALGLAEVVEAEDLFLGVNAVDYSGYPDCRPEFLRAFEAAARAGTRAGARGRPIVVQAPLLHMTKAEIVREAVRLGVPLAATISCYETVERSPCGVCDACLLRARGFREAGLDDPALA